MIFDEIYKKYYQVIVNYSMPWVKNQFYAEEVANKTFELLWEEWESKNFPNEKTVLTWLFRTANYKIKEHKRKKYNRHIPLDSGELHIADARMASYYQEIDSAQEEQKFREYMSDVRKRLTGDDLKLFDFKIVLKLPYIKIAEELNTTVPAIKMRWLRLKTRLRKIVQDITSEKL